MVETPWARLDDRFWMHPTILTVGNSATGVYARLIAYCGCYLTDGLVPSGVVAMIEGADVGAVDALARQGLVQRLESGAVIVSDYLDYNRSRQQIEEDRETRRSNGAKGGRPRANGAAP